MNYCNLYVNFLKKFLKLKRKLRVVFDCSNGTTGKVLKELFRDPSIRSGRPSVFFINEEPDGRFPAHGPNPMAEGALRDLRSAVLKHKADLGVIFDADGDRVFFVDDCGREIHPDIVAALISKNYKGPVILDVRAGYLARELIGAKRVVDSRVGHYFIKKLMHQKKIGFAAEISGHYYFKDFFYADSGIFAAIMFINEVSRISKLSSWIDKLPKYYQSGEINFVVKDKEVAMKKIEERFKKSARKISHLDGLRMEFEAWWFNLRPSNTEDLLRLNLEAKEKNVFEQQLRDLKNLL